MELRSNGTTLRIIASGPSLRGVDYNIFQPFDVLAVNLEFELLPFAKYLFFVDKRFFDWHHRDILKHPAKKFTCGKLRHPEVENYRNTGYAGFDTNPGCVKTGNNSGYAAINLAYHLGYRQIIIHGLDMKFSGGHSHRHNGHQVVSREHTLTNKMLPFFDTLKEPLEKAGVKVYNANPDSAVEVFEKITLQESLLIS